MNHVLNAAIAGLSVVSFSVIGSSAYAFTFVNGGFQPTNLSAPSAYIGGGAVDITGWTVNSSYSFLISDGTTATTNINAAGYGPDPVWGTTISAPGGGPVSLYSPGQTVNSADGSGWFIAMDGAYGLPASIKQTLTGLKVGQQYAVSFYQASAQQSGFDGDSTDQWQVNFGGASQLSTLMNHASQAPVSPWQKQMMTFTANSSDQVLEFLALGSPAGQPPFALLSGVSVAEIPTPALLPGLIGLGLSAWRKRKSESAETSTVS